jgi:ATP-dependent Lhr-like helicase
MASDVVLAEDESQVLQEFHERVLAALGDAGDADDLADANATELEQD